MPNPWIHRTVLAFSVATLLLIVVNGFMVSASTGLPVPEWAHVSQTLHRGMAGVVGLLALASVAAIQIDGGRKWLRNLAVAALVVVLAQAGLGMGLAKAGPMPALGVLQATLAHLLFALAAAMALLTSAKWAEGAEPVEDELRPSLRTIAWWPAAAVVAQIVLGSLYRHGLTGVIPHLLGAFAIAGALAFAGLLVATTYPKHRLLKGAAVNLVWLTLAQIVLGLIALTFRANAGGESALSPALALFTVGHLVLGSLTLAATVWFALQIRKHVIPAGFFAAASSANGGAANSGGLEARVS